jgi:hypothetical protein
MFHFKDLKFILNLFKNSYVFLKFVSLKEEFVKYFKKELNLLKTKAIKLD